MPKGGVERRQCGLLFIKYHVPISIASISFYEYCGFCQFWQHILCHWDGISFLLKGFIELFWTNTDPQVSRWLCPNHNVADPVCVSQIGAVTPNFVSFSSSCLSLSVSAKGTRLEGDIFGNIPGSTSNR